MAPRIPFSSPTAEEILSPVSPNFSHNSPQPWRKNQDDRTGKENTYTRKKSSTQKPPKRESSRRQERNQNKSRWPGLNVVTNFSKSPTLVHRATDAAIQHSRKKGLRAQKAQPGFVTLSDVKAPIDNKGERAFKTHKRNQSSGITLRSDLELRNHNENQEKAIYNPDEGATGLGLQHYDDPPDYDSCLLSDSKNRMDSLKPSPTKVTELSPSDRPIVIGISIPSARLAEHSISPEVGPTPVTPHEYTTNREAPTTPLIVVTPARDDKPWSTAFGEIHETPPGRQRAASSIYSRATHYGQGWTPQIDIPPVPVPPQKYRGAKHGNLKDLSKDQNRMGLRSRVDSDDTIFDEDDQAAAPNPNYPTSKEAQFQISNPSGTNAIGGRHPSQGWWNYVLSPFTTRSNTMMFRMGSPKSAGSVPTLSSPESQTATPHNQHAQHLNQVSSPLVEESVGARIDRRSTGTDYSRFENERYNIGLAIDHTPINGGPSTLNSPMSFDGFGAAAEYYNACWHDQNSPTPYFDCQNHSCFPSSRSNTPAPDDPSKNTEDQDAVRDLPDTENNRQALDGFQQTQANRFSAAFSHANRHKPRPLSEATEIEDLDETPVVREAHVAPVVHAGPPITAASVAGSTTKTPPMAPSSANAPNTTVLNTININHLPPYAALANDAIPASAARPSWPGSINQPPLSNAGSEKPREMVWSPQPSQLSSIQQPALSTTSSQRTPKRFVAVMPPDQVPSTREVPISAKPSFSSDPLFPGHSLASGSPVSSAPVPSNYAASGPPLSSEPLKTPGYEMSFSPAHSVHAASRSPLSYGPPVASRFQESSSTVPSAFVAHDALPSSGYANSRAPPISEHSSTSEVPASTVHTPFAFATTEAQLSSDIANQKVLPSSDPPSSSKHANSRTLLSSKSPIASSNSNFEPSLPFEAPVSSSKPLRPSRPALSSQLPFSSNPSLPSSALSSPQQPPTSHPPASSYTSPELLAPYNYALTKAPLSEPLMSPENTASRTLPSSYATSRAPPSEPPASSEPPLSSSYAVSGKKTSRPLSFNETDSRTLLSAEPAMLSQPLLASYTAVSDPLVSSGHTVAPGYATSRGLPSDEPMSSEIFSSPGYSKFGPALASKPPVPSGPSVSSGYVNSEPPAMKSRVAPVLEPISYEPHIQPNHAAFDVPPSSTPPRSSKDAKPVEGTSKLPLSSGNRASRALPPFESATINGPSTLSGPLEAFGNEPPAQTRTVPRKAVPRNRDLDEDQPRFIPHTYVVNNFYDGSGPTRKSDQVQLEVLEPQTKSDRRSGNNWELREKNVRRSRERRPRGSPKSRNCFKRDKGPKRPMAKNKKRLLWGIAVSLIILIILILALVMTLTRKGDKLNIQSQWLNITGFPPIPTGISTIVQPDAVHESSSCVQPATMWSCAVPKEEQQSIAPNDPDQPNFRVEIRFQNGTMNNSTSNTTKSSKRSQVPAFNPVSAGSFVRRRLLQVRDAFNSNLFSPSPTPPSKEDQIFLGNSTDKVTAPFNGESTPFFISFLPASKLPQRRLVKRQKSQSRNTTNPFPNLTEGIPPPDTNPDGTAASANLLPFPTAQPLRLYDRGLLTEHYGFYNYFDRSIFLKSTSLINDTGPLPGEVPDDRDGGAEESSATVRCTWRQTRFLVQIWTNQGAASPLLGSANHTSNQKDKPPKNLTESSANDFVRPGSFPYPVTITLDRHGGDLNNKFIYCYGMDNRGHIISNEKKIELEDRASGGGVLINPALGLFGKVNVTKAEGGPGGIDGGTGGCGCQWSNFGSG